MTWRLAMSGRLEEMRVLKEPWKNVAAAFAAALSLCLAPHGVLPALGAGQSAGAAPVLSGVPKVGEPAPDFTLGYATTDTIVATGIPLSRELRSGPVLLGFYPADWSPGCTREVCSFRDSFKDLGGLGITVWGISGDNLFAHHAWAQAQKLPFPLLSDIKHEVAMKYGSFDSETGLNHRTVFVVGRDGRIVYEKVPYSVKDDKDFEALKAALRGLK
jgi:peroxiredoxin